jgi:cytochrome c nitrite reductase small subunit
MNKLIRFLLPPAVWRFPVIIILGIFTGLGAFAFYISRAPSYLSNDPSTCMNCHIMAPQYATWSHSSHRQVAVCNDCHVPHRNLFEAYFFKAKDGLRHAAIFTLRREPQVIYAIPASVNVIQHNCTRCHKKLLADPKILSMNSGYLTYRTERLCWDCHREVPHGRVNSLSSVPWARVPVPSSPVPEWIRAITGQTN